MSNTQAVALMPVLTAMQLTDSTLPTGAFTHSFGFESYLQSDVITDGETFGAWLKMYVHQQLTFTDALAIRLVYGATSFEQVSHIDTLVTAQALPKQVREATITIGRRLLTIAAQNYTGPWLEQYAARVADGTLFANPATVWAVIAREANIDVDTAVAQHVYSTAISLTQNAVRAIPLGQNAGQRVIKDAQEWVNYAVEKSKELDVDDLGAIVPGLEIAQMNHEKLHSRLFMS